MFLRRLLCRITWIIAAMTLAGCGGLGGESPPASPSPAHSPTPPARDSAVGGTPSPFPPPLNTPAVQETPEPSPTPPTSPAPEPTPITPGAADPVEEEATPTPTPEVEDEEEEATPTPTPEDEEEEEEEAVAADIENGETLYAANCAVCHGSEGEGVDANPAHSGNPFTTGDPEPVIDTVLHGRGAMPAFGGRLSDQEIADVISYIRTAWENDAEPVTPEQVTEVREEE